MRDNNWLEEKMYDLWENNFVDVPRKNLVVIKFSKRSKRQLGCITWGAPKTRGLMRLVERARLQDEKRVSLIRITSLFKDEKIPDEVVIGTIAHEMCHYAHGFSSPLKQIYNHPHKGGVIRKEMEKRGLGEIYQYSKKWLKANWVNYLRTLG